MRKTIYQITSVPCGPNCVLAKLANEKSRSARCPTFVSDDVVKDNWKLSFQPRKPTYLMTAAEVAARRRTVN